MNAVDDSNNPPLSGNGNGVIEVGETVLLLHSQANNPSFPHLIGGHGDWVIKLAWYGRFLASSSVDGTVLIRDFRGDVEEWRRAACRRARRNLTQAEWERFVGVELPYQETCPELPPGRGASRHGILHI